MSGKHDHMTTAKAILPVREHAWTTRVSERRLPRSLAEAAEKLQLGRLNDDQGLVFCRPDGRPYWREAVRLGFRRVCRRAGVGEDWQPYELWHSFVSVLFNVGGSIEDISDAAGHSNSTVTREVYRHGSPTR